MSLQRREFIAGPQRRGRMVGRGWGAAAPGAGDRVRLGGSEDGSAGYVATFRNVLNETGYVDCVRDRQYNATISCGTELSPGAP